MPNPYDGRVNRTVIPHGLTLIWYGFASLCLGTIAATVAPAGIPVAWQVAVGYPPSGALVSALEFVIILGTLVLTVAFTLTGVFELIGGMFSRPPRE
jgi:hypothetical protein